MAQIGQANPVARKIFWTAYNYKKAHVMKGDGRGGPLGPVFDKLVFDKIRAKLGGRVQMMSSGASPISPEVFLFLRVVFGGVVLEGYGMTETACLITLTVPGDPVCGGHVGAVIPSCEVKLVDIPEMNYSNMDSPYPRGEICVRGPILFSGYLKNEAATRETIDETWWLHTGDVGMFIEGGRLRIFDRKKAIFKLAQGEYISPERIEAVHTKSPLILQSFVWVRRLILAGDTADPFSCCAHMPCSPARPLTHLTGRQPVEQAGGHHRARSRPRHSVGQRAAVVSGHGTAHFEPGAAGDDHEIGSGRVPVRWPQRI